MTCNIPVSFTSGSKPYLIPFLCRPVFNFLFLFGRPLSMFPLSEISLAVGHIVTLTQCIYLYIEFKIKADKFIP